jgi:hypothetical protein
MGNIREYTSPVDNIQIPQGGADVVARSARYIGQLTRENATEVERGAIAQQAGYQALAKGVKAVGRTVEDFQSASELRAGTDALVAAHQQLDADWKKTRGAADSNQPVGPAWLEKTANPLLDKVADGVSTQRARAHIDQMVAQAKLHYGTLTAGEDSAAAGAAAVRTVEHTVHTMAQRANADPSTLDYNLGLHGDAIEGALKGGQFSAAEQAKIRELGDKGKVEIITAAFKGMADKNPQQFLKDLPSLSGKYAEFVGQHTDQYREYARHIEREQKYDAQLAESQANIVKEKQSRANAAALMKSTVQPDGTIKPPSLADIIKDAGTKYTPQDAIALSHFYKVAPGAEKNVKNDPETSADLAGRLHDGTNPTQPKEITDAMKNGDITVEYGTHLLGLQFSANAASLKALSNNQMLKTEIDKAGAIIRQVPGAAVLADPSNPAVREKSAQFKADTLRILQDAVNLGGSQAAAPYLDPKDSRYLFSPDRIKQYQPTREEIAKAIVTNRPVVAPPKVDLANPSNPQSLNLPSRQEKEPLTFDKLMNLGGDKK